MAAPHPPPRSCLFWLRPCGALKCSASQSAACLRGPGSRARGGQGSGPCESRGPRPRPRPRPHHHPAAAAAAAAAAALTRVCPKARRHPRQRPEWLTRFHPNTHRRPHLRHGWLTRVHPYVHCRPRLRNGWLNQGGPSTLAALPRTNDPASARWVSAPQQQVSAWRLSPSRPCISQQGK